MYWLQSLLGKKINYKKKKIFNKIKKKKFSLKSKKKLFY